MLRIGGLASGMDIDGLVEKLMSARRLSTNKLFQQKQTIQWQRESYREMNTKIYDYRNNKMTNYRLEGHWLAKKAELSGNTSAITATATGNASPGSLTIQVGKLATAATNHSSVPIKDDGGEKLNPTKSIGEQLANFVTSTFSINGSEPITVNKEDSLNDIISRINKETTVSAYYDVSSGMIAFAAKETGLVNGAAGGKHIEFTDISGSFLNGILNIETKSANVEEGAATNAVVMINGLETAQTSNIFTINGVTIVLQEAGGAATTLKITNDTDAVVEKVKSFIDDYNEFMKAIQDKVDEARFRNFHPLTDEQKRDMKDREVELWEEKAMSGMLRSDPILTSMINDMRTTIYTKVENGSVQYNNLFAIGITTGAYNEKGKLYLSDENKLRQAIEEDPEAIMKLFAGSGTDTENRSDVGLAKKMYDDLQATMNRITEKAGYPGITESQARDESFIGRQLYNLDKRLDQENMRMANLEQMYYRQFAAMESAINRYNAQSAYLMNAFGGGGGF